MESSDRDFDENALFRDQAFGALRRVTPPGTAILVLTVDKLGETNMSTNITREHLGIVLRTMIDKLENEDPTR